MPGSLQGLELWLVILFPIIWNCWIITCQHRATYSRSASFQRFHMVETGNIQWRKLLSTDTILFPKYLSLDNCTHCLGLFRCDSFSDQGNERTPSFGMNHALHIWTTRTSTVSQIRQLNCYSRSHPCYHSLIPPSAWWNVEKRSTLAFFSEPYLIPSSTFL